MKKTTVIVLDTYIVAMEICRELRDAGYQVIVVGQKSNSVNPAMHIRGVSGYLLSSPKKDPEKLLAEVLDIGSRVDGPKVVIPANETYCIWMAQCRNPLSQDFHFLTPPLDLINTLNDKWQQYNLLKSINIDVPRTAIMDEKAIINDNIELPAVVKPRYASTSVAFREMFGRKVIEVGDGKELKEACLLLKSNGFDPVIQENVSGMDDSQYFFGGTAKNGTAYSICMAQKLKVDPSPNGSGMIVRTVYDKTLLALGTKILFELNYNGICDIEFKKNWNTGEYQLIEFNPRYGMGQKVMQLAGITSTEMCVKLAAGVVPENIEIGKPGFYWVYLDEWLKERIFPWRNRQLRRLRNKANAVIPFDLRDCRPEIEHVMNLVSLKIKRIFTK